MRIVILLKRFFHVDGGKREKLLCNITLTLSSVILIVLCLTGYAVVYARCYDIMNDEPLTVFEYNEEDAVLTFLGNKYTF
jgi:hypothetical protein